MSKLTGKVAQIIGPVIDVAFTTGEGLPQIFDSLEITRENGTTLGARSRTTHWGRYRKMYRDGFNRRIE